MLSPGTSMITATSFRELPARRKTEAVPAWLPSKSVEDGEEGEVEYKLSLVNGIPQMHWFEEDRVNELIQTFETRDDDVFVCTYVKSGTTWTQQIITLLLHKGEQSEKEYREVVPWLETLSVRPGRGPRGSHPEAKNWTLEALKSTPNRRFMKTHANLKDLPAGSAKGLKVIYVARNPKDVIVSLYHMATTRQGAKFRGFSDMLRFFVQGRSENGSWFNHVLEWWEAANADPEHVLFIKYENMLAAPEEYIRKIADFVDINHTPEIIEKTAAASTFNAMKQNPKANVFGGDIHLRKGGAGGWRTMFTVRESEEFDKIYKREMKGSGLTMDFGEGLVM